MGEVSPGETPRIRRHFADAAFGAAALVSAALLAYGLVSDKRPAAHVLPAVTLALSLGALFLPRAWKPNLLLLAICSAIPLYGLEFWVARRAHWPSVDGRSKLDVIADLRAQGIEASPTVPPTHFLRSDGLAVNGGRLFPLGGRSHRTTVFCNESGQWLIYPSDEYGFNNPLSLHTDEVEVVLLGDSFTHGACVQPGEDVAGQLRARGVRALNLGIGATGSLIQLGILREYAKPLAPPVVLWMYFESNDLEDLSAEIRSPLLRRYLDPPFSQGLRDRQPEIDQALDVYLAKSEQEATRDSLWKMARLGNLRGALIALAPARPRQFSLLRDVLTTARDEVAGWGGKLVFVYLPGSERYHQGRAHDDAFFDRRIVLDLVRDLGLPVIDFGEVLGRHPDPLSIFPGRYFPHYGPEGYARLADLIAQHLERDR